MEFALTNIHKSIHDVMRTIGYKTAYFQNDGETSLVRLLGKNDYPRFHLYVKNNEDDFIFSLHLDQKKQSYEGSHAHNGEYDGDVVTSEAERIKSVLVT